MTHIYQSPCGPLLLEATGGALCRCSWALSAHTPGTGSDLGHSPDSPDMTILSQAVSELDEYFRGTRRTFGLPLRLHGTPFCLKVWHQLLAIPYGTTVSYKRLAALVGSPRGARAVAMACSRNPLSIIVPCHRVISATGHPGGYTLLATPLLHSLRSHPTSTIATTSTATIATTSTAAIDTNAVAASVADFASKPGSTPAGIDIKTRLLALERRHSPGDF